MKIDLLLQGPIYPFTDEIVLYYKNNFPYLNDIILSCWSKDVINKVQHLPCNLVINDPTKVKICGNGNINYQLYTSLAGLQAATTNYVFKLRSDQLIHAEDLVNIVSYFERYKELQIIPTNPHLSIKGKIVCASVFTEYPYHPRDHVFFGYKTDLITLFNIPASIQPNLVPNFDIGIRAETYIGSHYCSKFSEVVKKHLDDPLTYLVDNSPGSAEAFLESKRILSSVFLVTPKIRHIWKKYNITAFKYLESCPDYKEYWAKSWDNCEV